MFIKIASKTLDVSRHGTTATTFEQNTISTNQMEAYCLAADNP